MAAGTKEAFIMDVEKATLIDSDADVEGRLSGKDAHILGRFRGEIELSGRLELGEAARVEAKVQADNVEIAGEFKGDMVVRNLVLLEKARVTGSVDAQNLAVREGALVNGSVNAGAKTKVTAPAPPPAQPAPPKVPTPAVAG
jgi:cytoskeletal protein CcmA (bactofilin family)